MFELAASAAAILRRRVPESLPSPSIFHQAYRRTTFVFATLACRPTGVCSKHAGACEGRRPCTVGRRCRLCARERHLWYRRVRRRPKRAGSRTGFRAAACVLPPAVRWARHATESAMTLLPLRLLLWRAVDAQRGAGSARVLCTWTDVRAMSKAPAQESQRRTEADTLPREHGSVWCMAAQCSKKQGTAGTAA